MSRALSRSAANRLNGKHQVEAQRASILDAAEQLFLKRGIDNTRMVDIAAAAGITKVTLYRYFPDRDEIALAIHIRMMNRIAAHVEPATPDCSPAENVRRLAQSMIRNFETLRDAYRYMALFDTLYLDHPPDTALTQWAKHQIATLASQGMTQSGLSRAAPLDQRFSLVLNTVVWFLEKLALRGELTWSDRAIPLREHLALFEQMIVGFIDRLNAEAAIPTGKRLSRRRLAGNARAISTQSHSRRKRRFHLKGEP